MNIYNFRIPSRLFMEVLGEARSIVSEALVTGKALRIEGGTYEVRGTRRRRRRRGGRGLY